MFYEVRNHTNYNIRQGLTYQEYVCRKSSDNDPMIEYLRDMHRLRYNIFVKKMKWTKGFEVIDGMEFDEYDNINATYIIHVNNKNIVDACVRLIKTDNHYMLDEKFSYFIEKNELPHVSTVAEITRFAVDSKQKESKTLFAEATSEIIKWGLRNDIDYFISLTRPAMQKAAESIGWDPKPMGGLHRTADDISIALEYTSNKEMLDRVIRKGLNGNYEDNCNFSRLSVLV